MDHKHTYKNYNTKHIKDQEEVSLIAEIPLVAPVAQTIELQSVSSTTNTIIAKTKKLRNLQLLDLISKMFFFFMSAYSQQNTCQIVSAKL